MSRRRFWLSICVATLMMLSLLACYAGYRVQQLLEEQHIELDWQDLALSWRGVQLHDVQLTQRQSGELHAQANQLRLDWLASEAPRYRLAAQGLKITWQPAATATPNPAASDLGDGVERALNALPWLPLLIDVRDARVQLPCRSGQCTLDGNLSLQRLDDALRLDLQLERETHSARLNARLQGLDSAPDATRLLEMSLHLDDQQQMELHSDLLARGEALQWSGNLLLAPVQEIAWVGTWLGEWTPLNAAKLPMTPQQAGIIAQWQLQLPQTTRQFGELLAAPGWLRVDAQLPQPWPLPGVGMISGDLQLDLLNADGTWQARQLYGNLQLDTQDALWLAPLPSGLRPSRLQLQLTPLQRSHDNELALQLSLTGQGTLELQANATLGLQQAPDWSLRLHQLQLDAHSPRVDLAGTRAGGLHLNLSLAGKVTPQRVQFKTADTSRLTIQQLHSNDLELLQAQLTLAGLDLAGAPHSPSLSGPLTLRIQSLQHPQLQEQGWQWQGRLEADSTSQALDGAMLADSGLSMALRLSHTADALRLNATLDELFLRAGNPLAQTLAKWPPLLTLDNGRIQADASLSLPPGTPLQLQAKLSGKGLAGIYDRSTLSGVDGELQLQLTGNSLTLELPSLSAKQIDPGIALGPLQLQANYQASLQHPMAGKLSHQRAELGILGGRLHLEPATWALDQSSQLLPLKLSGLDLQELFRVYPAEGLEGNGLLDGTLPLRLGGAISIEQGLIEARAPGGRLRFQSPRIRAMGQANPGMKLVTDALEDFHYDLLSSSLDYDPSGTLRLGMRLHGQNPAIERGRPIHFNINLEEDIPTLLASLQLTDKVSDIIQQRIQQRMRQRVPREPKE